MDKRIWKQNIWNYQLIQYNIERWCTKTGSIPTVHARMRASVRAAFLRKTSSPMVKASSSYDLQSDHHLHTKPKETQNDETKPGETEIKEINRRTKKLLLTKYRKTCKRSRICIKVKLKKKRCKYLLHFIPIKTTGMGLLYAKGLGCNINR